MGSAQSMTLTTEQNIISTSADNLKNDFIKSNDDYNSIIGEE